VTRHAIPHPVPVTFIPYYQDGTNWRSVARLVFATPTDWDQDDVDHLIARGHVAVWDGVEVTDYAPDVFDSMFAIVEVEWKHTGEQLYTGLRFSHHDRTEWREVATLPDGSYWATPWRDTRDPDTPTPG